MSRTNTLTRPQTLDLFKWATERKAELATMTAPEAADAATKAKGFVVTENVMRAFCHDAKIDLKIKRPYRTEKAHESFNHQVRFLAAQIYALTGIVKKLHDDFGLAYPHDTMNMDVLNEMRRGKVSSVKKQNGFFDTEE